MTSIKKSQQYAPGGIYNSFSKDLYHHIFPPVPCTWKNISACSLPATKACSLLGSQTALKSDFFSVEIFLVVLLALQLLQAGHGASGNPILQLCWCWIAWKERGLARGAVTSPHGQLPSPGAHGMKVNNRTLCRIAEFRAGGKP